MKFFFLFLFGSLAFAQTKPIESVYSFEIPRHDIKDFYLSDGSLCWLTAQGHHGCIGADFDKPTALLPEEEVVGIRAAPPKRGICLEIARPGNSNTIRCSEEGYYWNPGVVSSITYESLSTIENVLYKTHDVRHCNLSPVEGQKILKELDLDPKAPKAQFQHQRSLLCGISQSAKLKCFSCHWGDTVLQLNGSKEEIPRLKGQPKLEGLPFFEVTDNNLVRLGHFANSSIYSPPYSLLNQNLAGLKVFISPADSLLVDLAGGPRVGTLVIGDPTTQQFSIYFNPVHGRGAAVPESKRTGLKEFVLGQWIKSEIDLDGRLTIRRNDSVSDQQYAPDSFHEDAYRVSQSIRNPRNLKHYIKVMDGLHYGQWAPNLFSADWVDTERFPLRNPDIELSAPHEFYTSPFYELTCAQSDQKNVVTCWYFTTPVKTYLKPRNLSSFEVKFESEVVDYALGLKILCGLEKSTGGKNSLRCFELDSRGAVDQNLFYDQTSVLEVAAGFQHASFLTENGRLFHFNFFNDDKLEESAASGTGIHKLSAYSHHTCFVSDQYKAILCESDVAKLPLSELLKGPDATSSLYPARHFSRGELGWPVYNLETKYQSMVAVTSRGVEIFPSSTGVRGPGPMPIQHWIGPNDRVSKDGFN